MEGGGADLGGNKESEGMGCYIHLKKILTCTYITIVNSTINILRFILIFLYKK
jgi:hypothetical protein